MNESIKHDYIENVKHTNDKNGITSKDNKCLEDLITILKDEIIFLRNEIQSKDKVIELMLKVKFNERAEKQEILLRNQAQRPLVQLRLRTTF